MNAISIAILAVVAALVVLALYFAFRKGGSSCSCSACSKKDDCPYCSGPKGRAV